MVTPTPTNVTQVTPSIVGSPVYTYADSVLNVHDLNTVGTGLRGGVSISVVIEAFQTSGFADPQIADEIEMVIQTYSSTAIIPIGQNPNRQFQPKYFGGANCYPINFMEPEQFIDDSAGTITPYAPANRPIIDIGAEDTLQIPVSPDVLTSTGQSLAAMVGTTPPPFWLPNPSNPYTFTPDMAWLSTCAGEMTWNSDAPAEAAFEYMLQGLSAVVNLLWGNPAQKDFTMILGYAYELLSRFYGVTALGANLTAKLISTAKQYGLEYCLGDVVSSCPIDPDSKAYLKANSQYYTPVPFPRLGETAMMLMLQGYPVFLPAGDPRGVGIQAPEGITGQPLNTPMTVNTQFGNSLYRVIYPARLIAHAALGGNKRNIFAYPTGMYPAITDTGARQQGISDEFGGVVTPPAPYGTMYGAIVQAWRNQDGSTALPISANNSDLNDLEAAINAGTFTEQQAYKLVDQGIACDPVLNDLLFVEQVPSVVKSWDASHKNAQFLRELYLAGVN
jgi:hypothetical protein